MTSHANHIGLMGYGNVGSHLGKILASHDDIQLTIYNRSKIPDNQLPGAASFTQSIDDLKPCDFIIISVKDDAIIAILEQIEERISNDAIVVHCSGSIPTTVIAPYFKQYGALYPLQTFSKDKKLDYRNIPVFITGSEPKVTNAIAQVARFISPKISEISDKQRITLHIAAIFSCNYSNALYSISEKLCDDHQLDFRHLLPLIEETAKKIQELHPKEAQTGPAARGDWNIIYKHEAFLATYDQQINSLYREMADYISKNK